MPIRAKKNSLKQSMRHTEYYLAVNPENNTMRSVNPLLSRHSHHLPDKGKPILIKLTTDQHIIPIDKDQDQQIMSLITRGKTLDTVRRQGSSSEEGMSSK